jgi:hypothetical protein
LLDICASTSASHTNRAALVQHGFTSQRFFFRRQCLIQQSAAWNALRSRQCLIEAAEIAIGKQLSAPRQAVKGIQRHHKEGCRWLQRDGKTMAEMIAACGQGEAAEGHDALKEALAAADTLAAVLRAAEARFTIALAAAAVHSR